MKYEHIVTGRFLKRPNRFIAHVDLGSEIVICHVKNTGRCRELLLPALRSFWNITRIGRNPGGKPLTT